jgi:hypothetical protein
VEAQTLPFKPTLVYGGDDVGDAPVKNVVGIIEAHCLPAGVNLGAFYNNGGISRVLDLVNYLKGTDVVRYFISADDIKGGDQTAVNDLVDAVRGALQGTGVKVSTGSDLWGNLNATYGHMSGFHGDTTSITYDPYIGSAKYGPLSALRIAGAADKMANGSKNGVAWVQFFDWRWGPGHKQALPGADGWGFPITHISYRQVVKMYLYQKMVRNVFVVSLEPVADSHSKTIATICAVVKVIYAMTNNGPCTITCGAGG